MGVGLLTWRIRIGAFNSKFNDVRNNSSSFFNYNILTSLLNFLNKKYTKVKSFFLFIVFSLLLSKSVDIEKNPGPNNTLKLMHWNLNSYKTLNFYLLKLSILK